MNIASGNNQILEANELKKYCNNNKKIIMEWLDMLDDEATQMLIEEKLLETQTNKEHIKKLVVNKKLKEEAIKIVGVKKFLLDYSIISKRDAIEVYLWEDYLIFAQLLNIADKTKKQFKETYVNIDAIIYVSKLFDSYKIFDILFNLVIALCLPFFIIIRFCNCSI